MKKPLRIGLVMAGGRSWIGGIEYIRNLVLALNSLPADVRKTFELCLICPPEMEQVFYGDLRACVDRIYQLEDAMSKRTLVNLLRWKARSILSHQRAPRFDAFIRKEKIDFVYPHLPDRQSLKEYRSAAWIPDFQHKHLPGFFIEEEVKVRDLSCKTIASQAPVVVFSSRTVMSDFHQFYPQATGKAAVMSFKTYCQPQWFEVDPLRVQREYNLPDRFLMVCNQFWKHKNHHVVFEALKLLRARSIFPVIVCTGHINDYRHPAYSDEILQVIQRSGIAQQVHLMGLIPRSDQIQLMRRSLGVIQPSLSEGWSTVVEDARALGKPVILSNLPVHQEQDPPKGIFFDPASPESLASILADKWREFLPGPDLEQEVVARTRNAVEMRDYGNRFLEIVNGTVGHCILR